MSLSGSSGQIVLGLRPQSALGLISAQQPDFNKKPADERIAARALEREHVLEDRRELFT